MIELLNMDCLIYMRRCESDSFDLAIVDPPYFEVKGAFDFQWSSFDDYLKDVNLWAVELKRILKPSGHFFWWGNSKKIAYTQVVLDNYFHLENSMIWEKKDSIQYQYYSTKLARCFNTYNERVLYYSCEDDYSVLCDELRGSVFLPLREYMAGEWVRAGLTAKDANEATHSQMGCHYLTTTQWTLPTAEKYQQLREYANRSGGEYLRREYEYLRREYEDLRREYEDLRREYEDLRRPFNNTLKLSEVLTFSQQSNETKKYKHPTQKAPRLVEALVRVTGRKGCRAFIPFVGSGTELVACDKVGMDVVGCEIDKDYYNVAKERYIGETAQNLMF